MPAEGGPSVVARGLAAGYPGRPVLEGVELTVAAGEVRAIIGGSGCGKTTLLRTLIGLRPPLAGTVALLGENLTRAGPRRRREVLAKVGVLFQNGALLGNLSALENVALPLLEAGGYPPDACYEAARLRLASVGLATAAARLPRELSGGMQKRVGLARAMALQPPLLVCDEPSAGLDPVTAAGLDELLLALCRAHGTSIVVVTHELASIDAIADRVTFLGGGRVLADDTLEALRQHDHGEVRAFFERRASGPTRSRRSLLELLCPAAAGDAQTSPPAGGRRR